MATERSGDTVTGWAARPIVVRTLALLTALGVALALIGWLVLPSFGDDGGDDTAERHQVVSRANDFAVAYNTYDVADLDDYQKRLEGLLTPAYNKQFVEITKAVFGALETKKQTSGSAKVLGVAIDSIDEDSASAIVAVDASITNTDNKAAVERRFRWKITFSNTEGEWLVSNFESVASVEAEASPVPGAATPSEAAPSDAEPDAEKDGGQ